MPVNHRVGGAMVALGLLWALLGGCCLPAVGQAGPRPALVLADTTREYRLGRHWDVLAVRHDSVANVSFAQVTAPAWAARFRPSQQDVLSYGVWRGQVWLRTTVVNQASGHTAWMLRARLSSLQGIDVYLVKPDGRVQILQTGPAMSFAHSHNVPDRHINLALSLPPGQPVALPATVSSSGSAVAVTGGAASGEWSRSVASKPGPPRALLVIGAFAAAIIFLGGAALAYRHSTAVPPATSLDGASSSPSPSASPATSPSADPGHVATPDAASSDAPASSSPPPSKVAGTGAPRATPPASTGAPSAGGSDRGPGKPPPPVPPLGHRPGGMRPRPAKTSEPASPPPPAKPPSTDPFGKPI